MQCMWDTGLTGNRVPKNNIEIPEYPKIYF